MPLLFISLQYYVRIMQQKKNPCNKYKVPADNFFKYSYSFLAVTRG